MIFLFFQQKYINNLNFKALLGNFCYHFANICKFILYCSYMFAVVMYMQPLHLFPEKEEEKPDQPRRKSVSKKKKAGK